jgi:hypothetical protein
VEKLGQGIRRRSGVVMEEPDPFDSAGGSCAFGTILVSGPILVLGSILVPGSILGSKLIQARPDSRAESGLWLDVFSDVCMPQGLTQQLEGIVRGSCINANGGICRTRLVRQCRQGPGEIVPAVVGNHDGGNVYFLKN